MVGDALTKPAVRSGPSANWCPGTLTTTSSSSCAVTRLPNCCPTLATNTSPNVAFMNNNLNGPAEIVAALGSQRPDARIRQLRHAERMALSPRPWIPVRFETPGKVTRNASCARPCDSCDGEMGVLARPPLLLTSARLPRGWTNVASRWHAVRPSMLARGRCSAPAPLAWPSQDPSHLQPR